MREKERERMNIVWTQSHIHTHNTTTHFSFGGEEPFAFFTLKEIKSFLAHLYSLHFYFLDVIPKY